MGNEEGKGRYPGLIPCWRIGYVVLSAAITAIFAATAVLLEVSRQTALTSGYGGDSLPFVFLALILLLVQGFVVGVWLTMTVIFGCTHPVHGRCHWRWPILGLTVTGFMSNTIFQFTSLLCHFRVPPAYFNLPAFLSELLAVSIMNLVMAVLFVAVSLLVWFAWLKPPLGSR